MTAFRRRARSRRLLQTWTNRRQRPVVHPHRRDPRPVRARRLPAADHNGRHGDGAPEPVRNGAMNGDSDSPLSVAGDDGESRKEFEDDERAAPGRAQAAEEEPSEADAVRVSTDLDANRDYLARKLGFGTSFDVLIRSLRLTDRRAALIAIDGFLKDDLLLRIVQFLNGRRVEELKRLTRDRTLGDYFVAEGIGHIETEAVDTLDDAIDRIMAGQAAVVVDGFDQVLVIDLRTYPARAPEEPDLERVLRGPRDGFTETLVHNVTLVRRRLRDPGLRVELITVGARSKTDVGLLYIGDIANPELVDDIRSRLENIEIDGLPMAERSVEEFLVGRRQSWHLMPPVRLTERPDVTATHLLEGHVAVITDTSPAVMVLPATFFHHLQHAQEFHEQPVTGLYLRLVRYVGLLLSWFGPPLWIAAALSPALLPPALVFLGPADTDTAIPLFLQFVFAELGIDLIRLALIHTPSALGTSLGLIGAILVGDLAIDVGLFTAEVVLYVAIATIGNFATPSVELANAIRIQRMFLLVLAGLWQFPGFLAGLLVILVLLMRSRSFGVSYLYPLIPFNGRALVDVVLRRPIPAARQRPEFLRPQDPDRQ